MFLKTLTISKGARVLREIKFRKGINLIVDESEGQTTGNGVGKTTVLKLIDFCFGSNKKNIWVDPENKKDVYDLVKDYLIHNEILITLCLSENLDDENATEIYIERNFLSAVSKVIRKIDGIHYLENEFEGELSKRISPEHVSEKPTFRQIISHNIRYKDLSINNTLRTLDKYTSDVEYEALHLFLLGCGFTKGNKRQEILLGIKQEDAFKKHLEKTQTKSAYEATLSLIETEIEELNHKKSTLNINENFENDLNKLNQLKYKINKSSSLISKLNIRKELIIEANENLTSTSSKIDLAQLHQIYSQFTGAVEGVQKSFEDLVSYHNQMIEEKKEFITKELPVLNQNINNAKSSLEKLLKEEKKLSMVISKSDSFEELESIIEELSGKFKKKENTKILFNS